MNESLWNFTTGNILKSILNITEPFSGLDDYSKVTMFEFIIEGILITLIGSFGIVSNFASLTVLSRPQMRSSVNCGLQGLAVFDTVVLICSVLMLGLNKLGSRVDMLSYYSITLSPYIVPIAYPIGLIAQTGSVWTTVGVTVERYIAVNHPLKAKSLCTYRRARIFNLVVAVFSVFYNIPRFWEVTTVDSFSIELNMTVTKIVASPLRVNKLYYEIYHIWLYLFAMYFMPFLTLTILNSRIFKTVHKANQERQILSRRQAGEFSLAMMLICVVVVFLLCNILALIINIVEYFDVFIPSLVQVSNMLVTLNSSVNFVIYCIFGQKFKRTFLGVFCNHPIQRARFNDSLQDVAWIRFRTIKSSSGSLNCSQPGTSQQQI